MEEIDSDFQKIFRQFYPRAIFYAARLVGEDEAEDVVQDVFLELWKRKEEISGEEHIRAFLFRSIYNRSLNILRHRSIVQDYADSICQLDMARADFYNPDHNETLNRLEDDDLQQIINTAICELPEKCRTVFILSYIHDMKNKEIAHLLDISIKTVEVHIYKALKYLRQRLKYLTIIFTIFMLRQ